MDIKSINDKLKEFEDTGYINTREFAKMTNDLLKIIVQKKDRLTEDINTIKNKI